MMPIKKTQGVRGFYIEIAEALADEMDAIVADRGQTRRAVVEQALRRHFKNLPPMDDPPLPPDAPAKKPKKGK